MKALQKGVFPSLCAQIKTSMVLQRSVKKGCKKTLINKNEREVSCPYTGETSRYEQLWA